MRRTIARSATRWRPAVFLLVVRVGEAEGTQGGGLESFRIVQFQIFESEIFERIQKSKIDFFESKNFTDLEL